MSQSVGQSVESVSERVSESVSEYKCIVLFLNPNLSVDVVSGLLEVSEEQLTIMCVVLLPPDNDFSSSMVREESRNGM